VRHLWALLASLALLFAARHARAHATGVSRGEYRATGGVVRALDVFTGAELATTFPELDLDHDGLLSAGEVAKGGAAFDADIVQAIDVTADGDACAPHFDGAKINETDAVEVRATFTCKASIHHLAIDCAFLDRFSANHHHLGVLDLDGHETTFVAALAQTTLEGDAVPSATGARATSFGRMVWTGVEHILTGYDHLAFLVGLLLLGGRVRSLVTIITAFTVAHSITLCLAALRVVSLSPSFVEPAIALSIAYVGVENLFVADPSKRWRITFPFGLLHGFGFAGALMDLDLPRAQLPAALFGFNLGVELGQLGVLAVVLPVVLLARKNEWFRTRGVKVLSVGIAVAGVAWFIQRVWG
jgi:hydrogenase/urease accessory protein HupE